MRRKLTLIGMIMVLAAMVLAAPSAWAQNTTGAVSGVVTDPEGEPIPGAEVVVESANLMGPRGTATDLNGEFAIPFLPPSNDYTLTCEAMGYGKVVQSNITISLGSTTTLDVMLATGEEMVITARPPVINMKETKISTNLSEEELNLLPVSRSYQGIMYLAPSVTTSGLGGNPSVGSSTGHENIFQLNGLNTTDPVTGTFGTNLNFNFIREMEVSTGGFEAEYGNSTGGLFNVLTKSGSNEFHGEVFAYYENENFQATSRGTDFVEASGKDPYTIYDYGFDIGGPIIKDRLWFFVAYNPHHGYYHTDRTLNNINYYEPTKDRRVHQVYDDWVKTKFWSVKLTYRLSDKHNFDFIVFSDPYNANWNEGFTDSLFNRYNQMSQRYQGGYNAGLKWYATWTNKFFQEVSVGYTHGRLDITPFQGGAEGYGTAALYSLDYRYGLAVSPGYGSFTYDDRDINQLQMKWTYLMGNHEIKWGYTHERSTWKSFNEYTGGYINYLQVGRYFDLSGNPYDMSNTDNYQYQQIYTQTSPGIKETGIYAAAFIQDAWSVTDYLTLKAGLRWEKNGIKTQVGNSANFTHYSPRFGFTWDFAHNGKSKLYGSYGKYFLRVPIAVSESMDDKNKTVYKLRFGYNGGNLRQKVVYGATPTDVLPGTKNTYDQEVILGVDYEIMPDFSVGARIVYRELGRLLEDIGWYDEDTGDISYVLANPGSGHFWTTDTWHASNVPYIVDYPEPVRRYKAIELTAHKRFSNNWFLNANYTLSRQQGNTTGGYDRNIGQLNPSATQDWDTPSAYNLVNQYGILPNDRTHQLKIQGVYQFDMGIRLGVIFDYRSGRPLSKYADWPLDVEGYGIQYLEPRGHSGRTSGYWDLDIHAEYAFKIWKTELSVFADIFNLTNNQNTWSQWEEYYLTRRNFDQAPVDEDWGKETGHQGPRSGRIGFRWSF